MRSLLLVILIVAVSGLGAGCGRDKPVGDLQGKLDAALAINDVPTRDTALANVADSAAAAADAEIVKKAVSKINDVPTKDKAAASAALKLGSAGKSTEAAEVAKMINDVPLRDRTLSKLTK
jgi:hypothetical protein